MFDRHPLGPLLAPRSVALVGASPRPGSVGNWMLETFLGGGFPGQLHLVNPRYEDIGGRACHPSLAALPAPPDLAVLNVASTRMEALFDEAVAAGVGAAVIFDPCTLEGDGDPPLLARLRQKARAAGIPVCGGNGMGFYNLDAGLYASFYGAAKLVPGPIALIAHSGSVFTVLAHNDRRFRYNLVVSAGQEIGTTVDAYLDYAVEQPTTRVVALFIETVRNPAGFIAALQKARDRDVPVVICKVGRTEKSARLAYTHSGAVAGDDAAYDAVFDRYGALRAASLDDMMATALLLSAAPRPGPGGLAAMTDSGGLRELMIDQAAEIGVPFAELAPDTVARLEERLPHMLEAVNPLDAAGPLDEDFGDVFADCLDLLLADPDTAMASFEFDATDDAVYAPALVDLAKSVPERSAKPFFVVNSFARARNEHFAVELLEAGVPVLNGMETALRAVRHAFAYRDHRARAPLRPPALPDPATVGRWRARLAAGGVLPEADGLALLRDFDIPAVPVLAAADLDEALAAADRAGYPVALKTAAAGVHHKTEAGGVRLGLTTPAAVAAAYGEMAARLGPRVILAPMVGRGVELAFGITADPQFGPLVMVGAGGTLVELLRDRVHALAPFDRAEARRLLDRLRLRPLLDGVRGQPAADLDALTDALAALSVLAATLQAGVAELDANPVIAGPDGCIAVDALVVATESTKGALRHG